MLQDSLHLFISVLAISALHAILPNHWLPVVAIGRRLKWTDKRTAGVTMLAAVAHSLSTVIIGLLLAYGGRQLDTVVPVFPYIAAAILISIGVYFIWRHQHHHHFHLPDIEVTPKKGTGYIIGSLLLAMFMSPCLEVGALFLVGGTESMALTLIMALIYTAASAIGMTLFAWLAFHGLRKMDWHKLEHNSGLVSGGILILTGILFLFLQ
jgi:cytochrome c biogenesis protein CcdA